MAYSYAAIAAALFMLVTVGFLMALWAWEHRQQIKDEFRVRRAWRTFERERRRARAEKIRKAFPRWEG